MDTAEPALRRECRALIRGGSRSFYAASLLLPRSVGDPAIALYGFCRVADDAIDIHSPDEGAAGLAALAALRRRLDAIYAGCPVDVAADRSFAAVVRRFAIPRALPEALLEGFAWDASGRRYEDLSDVLAYAARVAGSVGAMMSLLMGARDPHVVARACELGVAMQLSNIARDVGEDARAGRLYLPRRWLRDAGVDGDAWLERPHCSPAIRHAVSRLLDAAERLYVQASSGIPALPISCRAGIRAALLLYREIGRRAGGDGHDPVQARAVVPRARQLTLLGRSLGKMPAAGALNTPPLPEVEFLVRSVAADATAVPARAALAGPEASPARAALADSWPPWWRLRARLIRLIALFDALERRERQGVSP